MMKLIMFLINEELMLAMLTSLQIIISTGNNSKENIHKRQFLNHP